MHFLSFAKAAITLGFCWDRDGDGAMLSTALVLLCCGCRGLVDVPRHCTVQSLQSKAPNFYPGFQIPPPGLIHSLHQPSRHSRCLLVLLRWMGHEEPGSQAHGNVSPRGASPPKPCLEAHHCCFGAFFLYLGKQSHLFSQWGT